MLKGTIIKAGTKRTPAKGPRVIAITSGKGGVGKSNVTLNLALALADRGQRVVVFDADLGLANVEVLLGKKPQYNLYDFLYHGKSIDDIVMVGPKGIRIISGGSGVMELANLSVEALKRLQGAMQVFDAGVDQVLVDTGAGLSKNTLAFLAAAHELVVVVTPEPTSITDAYGLIKVLSRYNVHQQVQIIVNKAVNNHEAQQTIQKLQLTAEHFLPNIRIEYLGNVAEDINVVQAVKEQKPFVLYNPNCSASRSIKKVANQLIGLEHQETGGLSGFFSRLSRLFS
ncbi:MinD/ParA family protein [Peptococcaceae bacterium 1198_IL3148]